MSMKSKQTKRKMTKEDLKMKKKIMGTIEGAPHKYSPFGRFPEEEEKRARAQKMAPVLRRRARKQKERIEIRLGQIRKESMRLRKALREMGM